MRILSKSALVSIGMLLCIAVPAFAMDVTIEWHQNAEADVIGYYFYYKAESSGPPYDGTGATEGDSPVYVGNVTRYTLHGLSDGPMYYFSVTAYNGEGFESDYSDVVQKSSGSDITAPQISNVQVSSITDSSAVIEWTTGEGSSSVVQYGTSSSTWGNYSSIESDTALVTSHSVTITGLSAQTTYYFRVGSTDNAGNGPDQNPNGTNPSGEGSFTTEAISDTTAPQISNIQVSSITDSSAVIGWTTNESSDSVVQYGTSSSTWGNYLSNKNDAVMVTSHSVTLTGLAGDTRYYFRVGSTDGSGNGPTVSNELSFTTDPDPDTTAPQIVSPPTVTGKTNTTATIEWSTDEGSTSLVQYGTSSNTWGNYPDSKNEAGMVTAHSVTITGLLGDTRYYFRVGSTDGSGNGPTISNELSFTTDPDPDTTAPQIVSPPTVTGKTNTTATIEWSTDEASTSLVQYGTSNNTWGNYPDSKNEAGMVTAHSVTITGLLGDTRYYFRVGSTDGSGNGPTISNELSFTTDPDPDYTFLGFPLDLQGSTPESGEIVLMLNNVPPGSTAIELVITVFDPDSSDEGRLFINGQGPVSLFGAQGTDVNTGITVTLDPLSTEFAWYQVGSNTLNFWHDKTAGFVIENITLDFVTPPQIILSPTVAAKTDATATIEWLTDKPSTSLVQYGTSSNTWGNYPFSKNDAGVVTSHSVTITGLSPETSYYFRVGSTDVSGDGPTISNEVGFTTDAIPDTSAPLISNVEVISTNDRTAIVEWTTDEHSNSLVQYGTSSNTWENYPFSKNDAGVVTSHSVTITGLSPETSYYFRVGSTDASGNGPDLNSNGTNPSGEVSFTTDATPDTSAPSISNVQVISTTDGTAIVEWTTDEPSTSLVQYWTSSNTWGNYPFSKNDGKMATSHSVTITGLSPETSYYFRVGSTDASGNGPDLNPNGTNPSEEGSFNTEAAPDTDAPEFNITYTHSSSNPVNPSHVDVGTLTITAMFDEDLGSTPQIAIDRPDGTADISATDMSGAGAVWTHQINIPRDNGIDVMDGTNTITISNATDLASNTADPDSTNFFITDTVDTDGDGARDYEDSDDDNDGLADSSDPDPLDNAGDTGWSGDYDQDGWPNWEEYENGSNLMDADDPVQTPPTAAETIPNNNAGIAPDQTRVPIDTSFAVRLESVQGIDITDTTSIKFTIDDGVNTAYERDLSETTVVRVTKLTSDDDTEVTELWVVYDRSNDGAYGNRYDFKATATISVEAKDRRGDSMTQGRYNFKVETQGQYNERMGNQPNTNEQTQGDSKAVTLITGDDRKGTKIEYDINEPVVPYFELTEVPALDVPNVETVGQAVDLQPPTVFDNPVKVTIPCPGVEDVRTLGLYLYNGQNWVYACSPYNDGGGVVQAGGEGWMVPNSLSFNNNTNPPTLKVEVYHFSAIQPGLTAEASTGSDDVGASESDGGGGGCFVSTARLGSGWLGSWVH